MSDVTQPSDEEVERLRSEVAGLQDELAAERAPRRWMRTLLSTVLILVACLLAPLSVVAVWARGEVTDTSRYVATVAPLASDPAIQDAVANKVTAEALAKLDIPALAEQAVGAISSNRDLTPQQTAALQALTGPLTSGIEGLTRDEVTKLVQSPQFAAAWVEANTVAHERLTAVLSGQDSGDAVQVQDNQVVLEVGNLVAQVKQRLLDRGFTLAEKIPATSTASIVLFDAPNITTLQTAYAALNALGFWLPLFAVTLAIIGVFVCRSRYKALAWFGFGLLLSMGLAALALGAGRIAALNALPDTVNQDAAMAFFDQFTLFLRQSLLAGAVAGAVLFVGGLLMGRGRVATGIRRIPVAAAAAIQRWLRSLGLGMDAARRWVRGQATALRTGAALIALLFVMLQRYKTPELILWTTVGLLVALFLIQILASDSEEVEVVVVEEETAPTTVL
jgi:hypothetical protein